MTSQTHKNLRLTFELNRTTLKRYSALFLFIFASASPLFDSTLKILFLVVALVLVLIDKPGFTSREANWLVMALLFFAPAILIDGYFIIQYGLSGFAGFFIIFMMIFAVMIGHRITDVSTILAYANLVTAWTLLSVIAFLFAMISPSILSFAFQYDYYGFSGLSLGLQNFVMSDDTVIFRNAGFASEPGIFQVFLNIATSIYFQAKKMTLPRFLILTAGIITANSTTGLVTFAAIVFFASNARYRALTILTLATASNQIVLFALTHYESKVLTQYAFLGRFEPILNALDTIQQHMLGLGTVRYDQLLETLYIGSHDTYTQTLMRFGIFGFFFFISALAALVRRQLGIAIAIALGSVTNNLLPIPAVALFLFVDWKRLHTTAQSKFSQILPSWKSNE